jgi:hypothetical protein
MSFWPKAQLEKLKHEDPKSKFENNNTLASRTNSSLVREKRFMIVTKNSKSFSSKTTINKDKNQNESKIEGSNMVAKHGNPQKTVIGSLKTFKYSTINTGQAKSSYHRKPENCDHLTVSKMSIYKPAGSKNTSNRGAKLKEVPHTLKTLDATQILEATRKQQKHHFNSIVDKIYRFMIELEAFKAKSNHNHAPKRRIFKLYEY